MARISGIICPLMSTGREVCYCDDCCALYIHRSKQPGCSIFHIALFLSGVQSSLQGRA